MVIDKNNLEVGKYYYGYGYWGGVIVKMEYKSLYSKNPYVNIEGSYYRNECLTSDDVTFREPTPKEIFWLDECIRLNKSIKKEDIDYSNMEVIYEVY